jgi:hypothetical protein
MAELKNYINAIHDLPLDDARKEAILGDTAAALLKL